MKLTSVLYQAIVRTFYLLPGPLRNLVLLAVRKSNLPNERFYKDIKYTGFFEVKVTKDRSFRIAGYGGKIENELFWKGLDNSLEPEVVWVWKKLLDRGVKTIVDIGANTGVYSLLSKAINPSVEVIAFEPSIDTYSKMVANFQKNGYTIKAEPIAISNCEGNLTFYDIVDKNQTTASLSPKMSRNNDDSAQRTYDVPVTTLDAYIQKHNVHDIGIIKVDVELHEPEALEGMQQTIRRDRPVIIIEILLPEIADAVNPLLKGLSYEFFDFEKHLSSFSLNRIPFLAGRPDGNWNYVAIPSEKVLDLSEDQLSQNR